MSQMIAFHLYDYSVTLLSFSVSAVLLHFLSHAVNFMSLVFQVILFLFRLSLSVLVILCSILNFAKSLVSNFHSPVQLVCIPFCVTSYNISLFCFLFVHILWLELCLYSFCVTCYVLWLFSNHCVVGFVANICNYFIVIMLSFTLKLCDFVRY